MKYNYTIIKNNETTKKTVAYNVATKMEAAVRKLQSKYILYSSDKAPKQIDKRLKRATNTGTQVNDNNNDYSNNNNNNTDKPQQIDHKTLFMRKAIEKFGDVSIGTRAYYSAITGSEKFKDDFDLEF